jgi:predicted transcriptional regulator
MGVIFMETPKIFDSEYKCASIVWAHEPVTTKELVKLCQEELEWKRTTTYTVLKRLCERGIFQNENSVVTSLIPKEQIQKGESRQFVQRTFGGSLPGFIAAFLGNDKLTEQEAEELKAMIDQHRED